jgi:N-6 DNA Methylase/TaqI-like C-terminal specificity domain
MSTLYQPLVLKTLIQREIQAQHYDNLPQLKEFFELWQNRLETEKVLVEEQWRQVFLKDLFDLLGYAFPKNYKFEGKTEVDSTKPDARLSTDFTTSDTVEVVVEWKGSNIDLEKIEKNKSGKSIGDPMYQAFGYLSGFTDCNWYIVGNFQKIRLLHRSKTRQEYQEFLLKELAVDVSKIKEFCLFLSASNLLKNGQPHSKTDLLLQSNYKEKEKTTNEFYAEFKHHRFNLFVQLADTNRHLDWHTSKFLTKAQTILDKITFIQFTSSRGLLQRVFLEKYVIKMRENAIDLTGNLNHWFWLRQCFGAVDRGANNTNPAIFGYNGELFKTDIELESLTIDDSILKPILQFFDKYDFNTQLSLDILGHIFEKSISDLEELREKSQDQLALIVGKIEPVELPKSKSKRKQDGVFYTNENITSYMTKTTLEMYIAQNPDCIQDDGINIKIVDPACGSGAFLNQAHSVLFDIYSNYKQEGKLSGLSGIKGMEDMATESLEKYDEYQIKQDILHKNIFGVDLNSESVEITKLSLWLKTIEKNKKMQTLVGNIKQGNSLVGFDWDAEFGEKNKNIPISRDQTEGIFDIVLMNPPYVNSRMIPENDKKLFEESYDTAKGQYDLYTLFIERALKLVKDGGFVGFIVPNKFLITQYGLHIRKYIFENCVVADYVDLSDQNPFPDASVYPVIMILQKTKHDKIADQNYNLLKIFGKEVEENAFIEKMEEVEKIQFNVWRPLASSVAILEDGNNTIVANGDVNRYFINPNKKGSLSTFRDYDIVPNKIILKKLCYNLEASLDKIGYYPINTCYCLTSDENLLYILAILNSSLMSKYARAKYSQTALSGGYIELRVIQLKSLPIPMATAEQQESLATKSQTMLDMNEELGKILHRHLNYYSKTFKATVSKKMSNLASLEWVDYLKEYEKQKISLTRDQKMELLEDFETTQKQLLELQTKIDSLDKIIDDEVAGLYGI